MMDHSIPSHVTGLYVFAVINLVALLNINLVAGEVQIINTTTNRTLKKFEDYEASFGYSIDEKGILGKVVNVSSYGCNSIPLPPVPDGKYIALIPRGSCDFSAKVYNAQKVGYVLAIVYNYFGSEELLHMQGGINADKINIPSVFVGYTAGKTLGEPQYQESNISVLVNEVSPDINFFPYLVPFAIVVAVCFIIMIIFIIVKLWRDRRRIMQSRLSCKHLKRIPIKKFKKGDLYDVCAICLDEYDEGEKLRILPCAHAYHAKCIDPWLTKNKKTCPVCKRRVIPGEETNSDTDSDAENGNVTSSERTPLLAPGRNTSQSTSSGGTFFQQSGLPSTSEELPTVQALNIQNEPGSLEDANRGTVEEEGAVNPGYQEISEEVVEAAHAPTLKLSSQVV